MYLLASNSGHLTLPDITQLKDSLFHIIIPQIKRRKSENTKVEIKYEH